MKKTVCAGVLLAMLGLLPMNTVSYAADYAASSQRLAAIDVGRIRAVLHLTPQQERIGIPSKLHSDSWPVGRSRNQGASSIG